MIGKTIDEKIKELVDEIRDLVERALLQVEMFNRYSENIERKITDRTKAVLFLQRIKSEFGVVNVAFLGEIKSYCDNKKSCTTINEDYCPIDLLYSYSLYCSYIKQLGYNPQIRIIHEGSTEYAEKNWRSNIVVIKVYVEYTDFYFLFNPVEYVRKEILLGFDGESLIFTEIPHQLQYKINKLKLKEG
jgi:hypothetical protein